MDRYSKYQEDGDQFVGRCCSGLPQMDERFATVGPFFKTADPVLLNRCIDVFFPNCPPLLKKVAEHALASLIYHYDYLCLKFSARSSKISLIPCTTLSVTCRNSRRSISFCSSSALFGS